MNYINSRLLQVGGACSHVLSGCRSTAVLNANVGLPSSIMAHWLPRSLFFFSASFFGSGWWECFCFFFLSHVAWESDIRKPKFGAWRVVSPTKWRCSWCLSSLCLIKVSSVKFTFIPYYAINIFGGMFMETSKTKKLVSLQAFFVFVFSGGDKCCMETGFDLM